MRSLIVLALLLFLQACQSTSDDLTPAQERSEIRLMRHNVLNELTKISPQAKQEIERSAGYAVFSNAQINIIFVAAGTGYGVVKNNITSSAKSKRKRKKSECKREDPEVVEFPQRCLRRSKRFKLCNQSDNFIQTKCDQNTKQSNLSDPECEGKEDNNLNIIFIWLKLVRTNQNAVKSRIFIQFLFGLMKILSHNLIING